MLILEKAVTHPSVLCTFSVINAKYVLWKSVTEQKKNIFEIVDFFF